ncbi:hypothetical protein EDB86DRAFT_3104509 [Lactarius hatsudake]|nr:hypothetical protein EDB86DRAFT_3104509 [Lactarius hatsudake]
MSPLSLNIPGPSHRPSPLSFQDVKIDNHPPSTPEATLKTPLEAARTVALTEGLYCLRPYRGHSKDIASRLVSRFRSRSRFRFVLSPVNARSRLRPFAFTPAVAVANASDSVALPSICNPAGSPPPSDSHGLGSNYAQSGTAVAVPPQPLASVRNFDETQFFLRVKAALDSRSTYHEFLELVILFMQDFIDLARLIRESRSFLGVGEPMVQLKETRILDWGESIERSALANGREELYQLPSGWRPLSFLDYIRIFFRSRATNPEEHALFRLKPCAPPESMPRGG